MVAVALAQIPEGFLSPEQAAVRLGVSVATLQRLARAGKLARYRVRSHTLYRVEDIEALTVPQKEGTEA